MKKAVHLVICVILCLFIGGIGGTLTAAGNNEWTSSLKTPDFSPPAYLFIFVWPILYALMGYSIHVILLSPKTKIRNIGIIIFALQFSLNFFWNFLFFKFHALGISSIEIILLWLTILFMIIIFRKINKIAAYIQIFYLIWISFASILTGSIWYLNN